MHEVNAVWLIKLDFDLYTYLHDFSSFFEKQEMCDQQRKEIIALQQQLAAKEIELKKQISELEEKLSTALAASKTGRFSFNFFIFYW